MQKKFIVTDDEQSAKKLREAGLKEIKTNSGLHVFINGALHFSANEMPKRLIYTDILSF